MAQLFKFCTFSNGIKTNYLNFYLLIQTNIEDIFDEYISMRNVEKSDEKCLIDPAHSILWGNKIGEKKGHQDITSAEEVTAEIGSGDKFFNTKI